MEVTLNSLFAEFGEELVRRAKANAPGDTLPNSISYNVSTNELDVIMQDYGMFVDKGVSGTKTKYNTMFSYSNKLPSISSLEKWAQGKGLPLKDNMTYKSLAFAIAKSIQRKGIRPTLFLTKPFQAMWKDIDIEEFANEAIQKLNKEIN